MAPLHGQKLSYLTPAGGFSFIFQISMYAGLFAALPLAVYHLHAFIKPALPAGARKSAAKVVLAASLLIAGGTAYGYFVAIPAALQFLTTFASDSVTPNLTADSYLSFFLAYVAGIAALSLLPLLLLFVHWINPLKPMGLLKSERWIIAGAFIVAAFITPTPDALNQTMIAAPIIAIYQLGVVAVLISISKRKRIEKRLTRVKNMVRSQPTPLTTSAAALKTATVRPATVTVTDIMATVPTPATIQSTSPSANAATTSAATPATAPARRRRYEDIVVQPRRAPVRRPDASRSASVVQPRRTRPHTPRLVSDILDIRPAQALDRSRTMGFSAPEQA